MASVTSLIRSLMNDANNNWATDAILLNYVNAAYRDVQDQVSNNGGDEFHDEAQLIVTAVPANQQDPGTQKVINDATPAPNQLPTNLKTPEKIWERRNTSTDEFIEMSNLSDKGGLPSRLQGTTLDVWEWRQDGIYFVGATQDNQIRLRYIAYFYDLTGPSDTILIRGAQNAIAFRAAELAGGARGSPLIEAADKLYVDVLETLINQNVRANQTQGVRRRPFSRRAGSWRGRRWF